MTKNDILLWGDLHTHLTCADRGEEILAAARENIDFCAVLLYPIEHLQLKGAGARAALPCESVGWRPAFAEKWRRMRELTRAFHDPGRFVTFLGYEWNGDRTFYGDHNVLYCGDEGPLDLCRTLPELYRNLQGRRAFVIPHHTGYAPGQRSKNWDFFDPHLSPVMEMYSMHGSSEGNLTPCPMDRNANMGPGAAGGTWQDGLRRGLRIGAIGSNDFRDLPGRWGLGRAAVWAEDCSREAIFDAIARRRTYAVTGDRIRLEFSVDGAPMGSEIEAGACIDAEVKVVGSHAIDRIELLHNGVVAGTWCHGGKWEDTLHRADRFKFFLEMGWGPSAGHNYPVEDWSWCGHLQTTGGEIAGLEKCFTLCGQSATLEGADRCGWSLVTEGRVAPNPAHMRQGLIFEIAGSAGTRCTVRNEGVEVTRTIAQLAEEPLVVPLAEESERRLRDVFGLRPDDLETPDTLYHMARKFKVHRAVPREAYEVECAFRQVPLRPGSNYFYVRVSQLNGQMAWSSPVWVESR